MSGRCWPHPISRSRLTDPDSRSMATSGRGSGVVGYNVQVAVETENQLIVTHEMKTLPKVAAEMALHVLAYNLTRVMNIMGVKPLLAAIRV